MLHDPKRNTPPETEDELPEAKPDLIVQCAGCGGAGIIRYIEIADRVCMGCFGTGKLSLPHQDEPTEDSVWDAAIELLTEFGIEHDPEVGAYVERGGEWICCLPPSVGSRTSN